MKLVAVLAAIFLAIGAIVSGCSELEEGTSRAAQEDSADLNLPEGDVVDVPDVIGFDGSDGESEISGAELQPQLAASDADGDIGEPRYDATGCQVVDQEPGGASEAEPNTEVVLYLDCRQIDWENQDGDEWEAFTSAFEESLQDGCRNFFSMSPNGSLYDGDQEYTDLDCAGAAEPDAAGLAPTEVSDDPESDGATLGFNAGCSMLLDTFGLANLYYGRDAYWPEDCEVAE